MIRGIYTSAAGMIAQQRRQQTLSNNLNNLDTPGYKSDRSSLRTFPEQLIERLGGDNEANREVGSLATGVYQDEMNPDFTQGTVTETGKATDVALITSSLPVNPQTGAQEGALLFNVRTTGGDLRYTRNGHFTLSPEGDLTDSSGNQVLSSAGQPIQLPSDDFQVAADGTIQADGNNYGQIGVSYAADTNPLVKEGTGLFRSTNGDLPQAAANAQINYNVNQGFVEGSNVQADQTVTDMMEAYRSFEANQKVLQIIDGTLDKAVNQVGRVN
ncbi:flagellar hook-basal body protein [Sporolactobacillus terrae]|uniref:Flagellar hook-basal body protein n=1 Tax=Sporolactobacillus terrae TaxID=269673 RepID=A0ABX5Q4H1_9BACL|nr:flagellar hook-basal body protein [Sporolactobacillus terrae]QAA21536.1 flagellar hook-basal body protein [Sporolactobacillus terrae]QAA24508.1 flagellar hook-basal body protein [Sporolactobacillus terrae]